MYETKCRPPKDFQTPVYYSLPRYYVIQVLSEMAAYTCSKLLFTVWSPDSTVAIEVTTLVLWSLRELEKNIETEAVLPLNGCRTRNYF
ncbi:hypothetical protein KUTeg_022355 [Tegillarca granosa]|uniref:Uncharacterized protein n=1 Tax=Tegillarca granosa TaxID=220873 RepID=A0ABQ9EAK3_TEGGR|nr:hypothetical protein KUTeg_022355 [Tegillarca granosa]